MSEPAPSFFVWDAEHGVMIPRRQSLAMRTYVDGEEYRLGVIEERSMNSHNHYFAALAEAWSNLPDDLAEQYQTVEKLRKHALIRCGYFDERSFVCSSKAEAQRLAAFVRPCDEYAIITVSEATVRQFTAKSQSMKAMGKEAFGKSKDDVLAWVAALIRVEASQLSQNAGKAA